MKLSHENKLIGVILLIANIGVLVAATGVALAALYIGEKFLYGFVAGITVFHLAYKARYGNWLEL